MHTGDSTYGSDDDGAGVGAVSMPSKSNKNHSGGRFILKRPVSFGNPALGTYHGNIYTLEDAFDTTNGGSAEASPTAPSAFLTGERRGSGIDDRDDDGELGKVLMHSAALSGSTCSNDQPSPALIEQGAVPCSQWDLVAMVDVPPEQVPEGIINLARSHRPWINHVRIVIAEAIPSDTVMGAVGLDEFDNDDDETGKNDGDEEKDYTEKSWNENSAAITTNAASRDEPYPQISAAENAASILAAEQNSLLLQQQQSSEDLDKRQVLANSSSDEKPSAGEIFLPSFNPGATNRRLRPSILTANKENNIERTYVVLLELCSDEAARQFIQDLHQKPYTSLDETQVCNIYPVVALQGTDGVSLQSPFFASSSSTPASNAGSNISANATTTSSPTSTSTTSVPSHYQHYLSLQEDYNCPVCLERMDLNDSKDNQSTNGNNNTTATNSIFTTVCNHSFHLDCLLKWQDSPCPVCRFDHSGLNEALSQCHVCGTTENNYVCLICGVVSCGGNTMNVSTSSSAPSGIRRGSTAPGGTNSDARYQGNSNNGRGDSGVANGTAEEQLHSHARQHYDETLHAYALDTHTQHVWDFCGQGYVHRLLQNKEDGKLVEVTDPYNTTSRERSLNPGLSEAQEGEVVHRKLEGMASAYYTLLKSQLEQQRIFYEGRLEEIRRDYNETTTHASSSAQKNCRDGGGNGHGRKKKAPDLIAALKQERHQLSQRLVLLQSRRNKVKEDASFLISMNESLEKNKDSFRNQVVQAQQQRQEVRRMLEECLPPLQEKVTRLMLQLESEISSQQPAKESSKKLPGN